MSYARSAVTRMTLDMSRPDLQRSETVTLGDTNRRWEVTLINGGAPFRLPPNWTAALTGIKPDGNGLQNGCSVVDGKIIYDFAAGKEIATCVGSYPVQFDVWDEVGELVASPKVYVNVLADVRPHAELDSEGQYTLIGDLIGRVNQTDADVDLLGETALAQGDDIAALKEKVTTAGSVTIPTTEWCDDTPRTAIFKIDELGKGMTALLYPSDEETRKEASRVKLSAYPQLYWGTEGSQVEVVVSSAEVVPTKALYIDYIVIKTDNTEAQPRVALIGVDAYGEGGSTASGVDEDAVKALIVKEVPEWARAKKKPEYTAEEVKARPATWTPTAEEIGARPSTWMPTAANVGADQEGTAQTLVNDLARKTAQDLANYYTKSQTLTKDEINTLVSAIPKFKIEVVTSLPSSNISEATVYLVKSGDDSSNLYIEYIRANGAWERLGTQTVDLTGYATEAWVNELIADYVKTADMDEAISAATKDLAPKSSIPTVPEKLPNPHALTINGKTYDGSSPVNVTVEGSEGAADTVDIYLNDEDVAIVGHEYNLYHYAIVHGKKPYTEYDIAVILSYVDDNGKTVNVAANNYEECFRFTPTEARDYSLTYLVREIKCADPKNEYIAKKTITIQVIEDTAVSGKKILIIGDSFTDAGVWPAELQHNLSHGGIVSIGTVSDTVTIGGQNLTVLHEGRQGWATWDYAGTSASMMSKFISASNVFRNPSTQKFDLSYYMTTYHPGVTLNAVCVFLGTNGLGAITSVVNGMTELIARIREYDATVPILLHYTLQNVGQDYWSKFAEQKTSTKWYRQHLWREQYEHYRSLYSGMDNVYIVPVYENLDYDLDFPKKDFPASARNPATVSRVTDGHPDKVGYLKMADVYYAYLLKYMREGGEVEEPEEPDEPDEPAIVNLADPSKVAPSGATPSIADDYWWSGYNISNKAITSRADIVVTNKIPVTKNQRIRIKGFQTEGNASGSTARGMFRVLYCDADGNAILTEVQPATSKTAAGTGKLEEMNQDELANGVYCWSPAESSSTSAYLNNLAYIRVCGAPLDGDVRNIIITVDEQIE